MENTKLKEEIQKLKVHLREWECLNLHGNKPRGIFVMIGTNGTYSAQTYWEYMTDDITQKYVNQFYSDYILHLKVLIAEKERVLKAMEE